ncbi:MAG: PD-(D/E)XK nuclease-like domain-containing protein [Porcipelethomonas sp.]
MTNAQYHNHPAISKSDLDLINRSPIHYKYIKSNPKDPTEAMLLGSVLHKLILEADTFTAEYAIAPVCDRRTSKGKAEYNAFKKEAMDKVVITSEMFAKASVIAGAVRENPIVKKLLCGGKAEQSYFWEEKGIECKCRPDYLKGNLAIDLKSTADASPEAFTKSAYNYRYHVQAWWYLNGLNKCGIGAQDFIFIAFEKDPPYCVCVYAADDLMLELGESEAMRNLDTYRECLETGNWHGYEKEPEIHSLSLPDWVIRKYF